MSKESDSWRSMKYRYYLNVGLRVFLGLVIGSLLLDRWALGSAVTNWVFAAGSAAATNIKAFSILGMFAAITCLLTYLIEKEFPVRPVLPPDEADAERAHWEKLRQEVAAETEAPVDAAPKERPSQPDGPITAERPHDTTAQEIQSITAERPQATCAHELQSDNPTRTRMPGPLNSGDLVLYPRNLDDPSDEWEWCRGIYVTVSTITEMDESCRWIEPYPAELQRIRLVIKSDEGGDKTVLVPPHAVRRIGEANSEPS